MSDLIGNSDFTVDGLFPDFHHALAEFQVTQDWEYRDLLRVLHTWAEMMNVEFKLHIPEISLCVDWLRCTRLGHFRYGHNGFGLKGEVALNRHHLDDRPFWTVLGTLLHELLHAWQQAHGKPGRRNYHNREFRNKAARFGLIVDTRGHTTYAAESPFMDLLEKHEIHVPELPELKMKSDNKRGNSKLKKWSCGCTNARVAVHDFRARCLKCGNDFVCQDLSQFDDSI